MCSLVSKVELLLHPPQFSRPVFCHEEVAQHRKRSVRTSTLNRQWYVRQDIFLKSFPALLVRIASF